MFDGRDFEAAERMIDDWQADIEARAARARELSTRLSRLSARVRSQDELVTVTVGSAGDLTGLEPHSITRRGMSYVPQLDNVFASLSVEENLEMGSLERSRTRERIDRMYELFPRLGERRTQTAGTMSGGERQMLAMARALMPEPHVLLLDEPSAGLAPAFVEQIFDNVREINEAGVTVVMVEQNARRALAMSDRGYVLDLGRNRFQGAGSDLLEDPKVAELYLGGTARLDSE